MWIISFKQIIIVLTTLIALLLYSCSSNNHNEIDNTKLLNKEDSINIVNYLENSNSHQDYNLKLSIDYAIKAYNLAEKTKSDYHIAQCSNALGEYYSDLSKFEEAFKYSSKAIEISKKIGDSTLLASAFSTLANIYNSMGSLYSASQNLNYALEIYDKTNDLKGKALCLSQKATIYLKDKNFKEVEAALNEALKINELLGDSTEVEICNILLGENYLGKKEYDKSHFYFSRANEYFLSHTEKRYIVQSLCGESEVYIAKKMYEKAFINIQFADEIANTKNKKFQIARTQFILGKIYTLTNQYDKANESFQKSLIISTELNLITRRIDVLELIAELKIKEGNYKEAYSYFKTMHILNDSITTSENNKRILELELINDNKRKETKIKQQDLILDQNQEDAVRRNTTIMLLFFLLVIFALLVGFFFKQHRLSAKHNLILEETNEQIELQKNELKKLNATKDRFISIIAHDLKSPFNSLLGLSIILNEKLSSPPIDNEKLMILSKSIKDGVEQTYLMLQNLLNWSLASNGRIKVSPEIFNLNSTVYKVVSEVITQANEKEIRIEVCVDPEIEVIADLDMIKVVIRNLLSNALKFSEKKSIIMLNVNVEGEWVFVSIEDQGVGMSSDLLEKLFSIEVKTSTKGTNGETGTGLGLMLCKEFIELNKGTLEIESKIGIGSTFKFNLPLAYSQS